MRVFLSAYSGFTLAVPMNAVAAMMLPSQETEKTVQYDQASRSTFVSLPRLFNLPDEAVRHGIVLREWNSKANKVVLLTAEVKRDIEIPDEQFHPIPKALGALRFSAIFSGIQFSDNPVLLLNIEKLAEVIQQDMRTAEERKNQPIPVEESEPQVTIEEKSEPQVIVEEKIEPVLTEEKSEPLVIVEEKIEPLVIEEEKEQPITEEEEESDPQITIIVESEQQITIIEEKEPQITVEESEQPSAEEESDPLVIDEIIELQEIDEE